MVSASDRAETVGRVIGVMLVRGIWLGGWVVLLVGFAIAWAISHVLGAIVVSAYLLHVILRADRTARAAARETEREPAGSP